ncbi:MAG: RimK/LysX family protein [Crocinitomicaceae bacterium]|nr:RimK/LysX family protein [Crocinitomicaceae bacterium]
MSELKIIGRKDKADLPSLNLQDVDVKIDSGAYSCSIHCESFELIEMEGKPVLVVVFLDAEHPQFTGNKFYFENYKTKKVKSSTGHQQERFFVSLDIVLFGETFKTDFSLTKRNGLRNPILLGRKLLNHHFIINTTMVNLSYKLKREIEKSNI